MKSKLLCAAMLLVLPSAAPAATYNIPINLTASVYVYAIFRAKSLGISICFRCFPSPPIAQPVRFAALPSPARRMSSTPSRISVTSTLRSLRVRSVTSAIAAFWGYPMFQRLLPGVFSAR